ncbi:hypothetical protein [Mycobacterium tilburgii]|uniref:hypothetical protein n=1 Tax=Mycobacterium tilburgii TaxID=44467 RepID=UPI0011836A41|nr:hypothetical protein [Mycobacterium tilburgii]
MLVEPDIGQPRILLDRNAGSHFTKFGRQRRGGDGAREIVTVLVEEYRGDIIVNDQYVEKSCRAAGCRAAQENLTVRDGSQGTGHVIGDRHHRFRPDGSAELIGQGSDMCVQARS